MSARKPRYATLVRLLREASHCIDDELSAVGLTRKQMRDEGHATLLSHWKTADKIDAALNAIDGRGKSLQSGAELEREIRQNEVTP